MTLLLERMLPLCVPSVVRWAAREEQRILRDGVALTAGQLADAEKMGVRRPERIRVLNVECIPAPGGWFLQRLGRMVGLTTDHTAGMALGYGIFVRADFWGDRRLLAHECVHTAQCERLGGLRPFLFQYLRECVRDGYARAPLEVEAREKTVFLYDNASPSEDAS